jgi:hypothetical protein
VASRAERGVTGRASKGLDLLSATMCAIPHQGVDSSVSDAEVRTLVVGTGEALSVYPLGSTPPAFDLTPGRTGRGAGSTSDERVEERQQAGQSSGVRGLSRRWILVWIVLTLEWGGL